MAGNNFLPFNMQENGGVQGSRFIPQQGEISSQALAVAGMSMASPIPDPLLINYQNPYNSLPLAAAAAAAAAAPTAFDSSSLINGSGDKSLGVGRSSYMIQKLHQAPRFGIGAGRAAARASWLRSHALFIASRQTTLMNQQLLFGGGGAAPPALTCLDQDNDVRTTSNLLDRCGVEIRGDEDDDKLMDGVDENDDGLDLSLKL